jgi:hypothetical protein
MGRANTGSLNNHSTYGHLELQEEEEEELHQSSHMMLI